MDAGTKKLCQLYTKLVAEASSGPTPLTLSSPTTTLPPSLAAASSSNPSAASAPFPFQIIQSLTPLVAALRKMPLPSTHPSHPGAKDILNALKGAQRGYADMRGNWVKKCLELSGRRTREGIQIAEEVGKWIKSSKLLTRVFVPFLMTTVTNNDIVTVGKCSSHFPCPSLLTTDPQTDICISTIPPSQEHAIDHAISDRNN